MQKNLPWIERLDLVNAPAPLAPELAFKEDLHGKERATKLQQDKAGFTLEEDVVHNDFKREMMFYRQAQAAVLEAIPRLHSMNIRTKRPEDYFAQMAKTDEHMNKIRTKLLSKEQGQERAEKMSKLRELKKNGKNSADDVSGFRPFNKGGAGAKFGGKPGVKGGKKVKGHNKRPGKGNRQKMKNKKK